MKRQHGERPKYSTMIEKLLAVYGACFVDWRKLKVILIFFFEPFNTALDRNRDLQSDNNMKESL